jgi:hypothetical protein
MNALIPHVLKPRDCIVAASLITSIEIHSHCERRVECGLEDSRHFWYRCYIHVRLLFLSPEAVAMRCTIKCYIVPVGLCERCPRACGSAVVMNFAATNGTQGLLLLSVYTAYRAGPYPEPYESPLTSVSFVCKVQFNVIPF